MRCRSHVGRLSMNPSEVGVTKAPCGSRLGRLRVVVMPAARSWNSGGSHTIGLEITMPTLGRLPMYLSVPSTCPRPKTCFSLLDPIGLGDLGAMGKVCLRHT